MIKSFLYCLLLVLLLPSCFDSSSSQNQVVAGKIQNNSEYKGGANPPQEILDSLAIYRPSAHQDFYVRSMVNYAPFAPILSQFTTDANGNYTVSLPMGSYAVIGQDKYDFEQNTLATVDCYYLQEPDFILTVEAIPQTYFSSFTLKANYCLGYPQ